MSDVQIESDPLFQLLTDALRAGPQSAEWSQAVARVREGGGAEADEYSLLLHARENLESGKEYKAVRAGAGFTRNLFGKIDEEKEAVKSKGPPTANLLAIGAGVVLLGVIVIIAFMIGRGGGEKTAEETLPALFPTTIVSTHFAPADTGMTLGGQGATDTAGGLKPGTDAFVARPIEGRFEIEADVSVPPGASEGPLVQVIVPGGDLDPRTSGAAALSLQLLGGSQRVVVGDQNINAAALVGGQTTVRIVVGNTKAAVYSNKQLLWSGNHGLPPGPKTPGVRVGAAKGANQPVVTSVRVRTESKATSAE